MKRCRFCIGVLKVLIQNDKKYVKKDLAKISVDGNFYEESREKSAHW